MKRDMYYKKDASARRSRNGTKVVRSLLPISARDVTCCPSWVRANGRLHLMSRSGARDLHSPRHVTSQAQSIQDSLTTKTNKVVSSEIPSPIHQHLLSEQYILRLAVSSTRPSSLFATDRNHVSSTSHGLATLADDWGLQPTRAHSRPAVLPYANWVVPRPSCPSTRAFRATIRPAVRHIASCSIVATSGLRSPVHLPSWRGASGPGVVQARPCATVPLPATRNSRLSATTAAAGKSWLFLKAWIFVQRWEAVAGCGLQAGCCVCTAANVSGTLFPPG